MHWDNTVGFLDVQFGEQCAFTRAPYLLDCEVHQWVAEGAEIWVDTIIHAPFRKQEVHNQTPLARLQLLGDYPKAANMYGCGEQEREAGPLGMATLSLDRRSSI